MLTLSLKPRNALRERHALLRFDTETAVGRVNAGDCETEKLAVKTDRAVITF